MPARITVRNPTGPARSLFLSDDEPHEVGRDPGCSIQIVHPSVSRHHARLSIDGQHWRVEDLGSKNGTFLSGEKIDGPQNLGTNALLQFGDVYCSLAPANRHTESIAGERLDHSRQWRMRLSPSLGSRGLVTESLQAILELSDFHRGFALLASEDKSQWRVISRSGIDSKEFDSDEFSGSLGSVRECVRTCRPVVCHELDPSSWLGGRPSVIEGGIQALMCLPLAVGDDLLGVIYADRTSPGEEISELDLNILESLASHAAMALALTRMEELVQSLSGDPADHGGWFAGVDGAGDDTLLLNP